MAESNALLPLKQQSVFHNVNENNQFSNFKLNQSHKCLNLSLVQSNCKSISYNKCFGYCIMREFLCGELLNFFFKSLRRLQYDEKTDSKIVGEEEKQSLRLWSKSSSNTFYSKTFKSFTAFDDGEENVRKKRWKNSNIIPPKTSSTLSLHIAAYENSVQGEDDTVSLDKNRGLKRKGKLSCLIREQISINSTLNPFEFPRQQTDDKTEPAVMQFRTSQQLLNPNQSSSSDNNQQGTQNATDNTELSTMFFTGLLSIIYVYIIGFIFSLKEFWKDRNDPITVDDVEKKAKVLNYGEKKEMVAVVTGADGQIGKEIVRYLLQLGYTVCSIGFKNPMVSEAVKHYPTDLSEKDQVIQAAKQICIDFAKGINLVFCNAGVMLHPFTLSEVEHIEMHLAVNVLGHAILVKHLQPILKQTKNRVIFVSSATCRAGFFSNFDVKVKEFWQRKLNGYQAYANSKLLSSILTEKLAEEECDKFPKTTFASVHPGVVPGRLYRYTNLPFRFAINSIMAPYLRTNKTAALRILDLAFTPTLRNGGYYEDGTLISVTSKIDPFVRRNLYSMILREIENQGFSDSNDPEISDMEVID